MKKGENMEKKTISMVWTIIGSSLVWAFTIVVSALMLRGTGARDVIFVICGAAVVHFIVIIIPMVCPCCKKKECD